MPFKGTSRVDCFQLGPLLMAHSGMINSWINLVPSWANYFVIKVIWCHQLETKPSTHEPLRTFYIQTITALASWRTFWQCIKVYFGDSISGGRGSLSGRGSLCHEFAFDSKKKWRTEI
jgi:hypothetical protein